MVKYVWNELSYSLDIIYSLIKLIEQFDQTSSCLHRNCIGLRSNSVLQYLCVSLPLLLCKPKLACRAELSSVIASLLKITNVNCICRRLLQTMRYDTCR